MTKITNNVKIIETDSQFLDKVSYKITTTNQEEWYHIPNWYRKVSDGVYEEVELCNLPSEVIRILTCK